MAMMTLIKSRKDREEVDMSMITIARPCLTCNFNIFLYYAYYVGKEEFRQKSFDRNEWNDDDDSLGEKVLLKCRWNQSRSRSRVKETCTSVIRQPSQLLPVQNHNTPIEGSRGRQTAQLWKRDSNSSNCSNRLVLPYCRSVRQHLT